MINPIDRARDEHGLSVREIAVMGSVDVTRVRQIQAGDAKKINGGVLDVLVMLGYNREEVQRQYAAWRSELAKQMRARLVAQ